MYSKTYTIAFNSNNTIANFSKACESIPKKDINSVTEFINSGKTEVQKMTDKTIKSISENTDFNVTHADDKYSISVKVPGETNTEVWNKIFTSYPNSVTVNQTDLPEVIKIKNSLKTISFNIDLKYDFQNKIPSQYEIYINSYFGKWFDDDVKRMTKSKQESLSDTYKHELTFGSNLKKIIEAKSSDPITLTELPESELNSILDKIIYDPNSRYFITKGLKGTEASE